MIEDNFRVERWTMFQSLEEDICESELEELLNNERR